MKKDIKKIKVEEVESTDVKVDHVEPSLRTRVAYKFVYAALAVVAILIGIFLYWAFQSENVVKVNNEPFPTRTIREHPTAGGVVILTLDYCKLQEAEGRLRISFNSASETYLLPVRQERSAVGCRIVDYPVLIPETVVPGEYIIRFRVEYNLNPLKRDVIDEFESRPVIVDPSNPERENRE